MSSSDGNEPLTLDADGQAVYGYVQSMLDHTPLNTLSEPAIPTIVSLSLSSSSSVPSVGVTSSSPSSKSLCPETLRKALEGMQNEEGNLDQQESLLIYQSPLTIPLTQLTVPTMGTQPVSSPQQAMEELQASVSVIPQQRRVCQTQFRKNDMIYMCRTCQTDPTCALCHTCFSDSNHEGHDVAFFHAQEDGGCCDCGDADAWDPNGFCTNHGDKAAAQGESQLQTVAPTRAVCQYPFQKNDMIYMCRTCQTDPTCAMCHDCFSQSNHEGHDVAFFHAQETGGCCDCGDPEAWSPTGFCPNHGGGATDGKTYTSQPSDVSSLLPPGMVSRVQGVVPGVLDWMVNRVAKANATSYERVEPTSAPSSGRESLKHIKQLGKDGCQGQGLFLILYYDDIHAMPQWMDMIRDLFRGGSGSTGSTHYYNDTLIGQLLQALQKYGMLVVLGPCELEDECGSEQVRAWLSPSQVDSDGTAGSGGGTTIASVMFNKARRLLEHGFSCRIVTLQELQLEQRALGVLQWMSVLTGTCDPLCQTVAENVLTHRHLVQLLQSDHVLSPRVKKVWYSLLLKLLAIRTFKTNLGRAYGMVYRTITSHYARGRSGGALDTSAYSLSVQFLNQDKYLLDLIAHQDWLGTLSTTLVETLRQATNVNDPTILNPNHLVLSHRRYQPCITDIMYALNVQGIKRIMANPSGTFLPDFLASLSLGQGMDSQIWRHWDLGHVEQEELGWYGAFNWIITMGGIIERLMWWRDDDPCPESLAISVGTLPSCVDVTYNTLISAISKWQQLEMQKPAQLFAYDSAGNIVKNGHQMTPLSLPFSSVATKHGCATAMAPKLTVTQSTPFSLHLPLHRFVATCLQELCLRSNDTMKGIDELLRRLLSGATKGEVSSSLLFHGLTEFPAFVTSRAAQVRAGLWRRNGPGLGEQVTKYTDPSYCRFMRDPDLLLLQFAALLPWEEDTKRKTSSSGGFSFLIHLLLHRYGLFDFCGFARSPNANLDQYERELKEGWFPRESGQDPSGGNNGLVLPWTYTPARDAADCRALLEEFLCILIIFATELPPVPPKDEHERTEQAKERLRRHVVHRLAASPKTYGELVEISACMSFQDNMLLNEAGKIINPDDATAAMLGLILDEVADGKASRSRLEPDKFHLKKSGWDSYDPSFFHISVESHQTAAENRPNPSDDKKDNNGMFGGKGRSFAPKTALAHPTFMRLRRDLTSDSTSLSIVYRVLHMHCSEQSSIERLEKLQFGKHAYEKDAKSEIALARALHLLTVGAYAWENAGEEDSSRWDDDGGNSSGSVFFDKETSPTVSDWITSTLLVDPGNLLDCAWYSNEDKMLILLKRLAVDGGASGNFIVQDPAVQAGAAWICEFAVKHSPAAAELIGPNQGAVQKSTEPQQSDDIQNESEMQKRKRLAKERAMAKMNAQAAKFTKMMGGDLDQDGVDDANNDKVESEFERKKRLAKERALAKINNQASKFASTMGVELGRKGPVPNEKVETEFEKKKRLAKEKALAKINNQASKFASMMGVELEGSKKEETELEKKKRLAKERALAKMNAQASQFASMMAAELGDDGGNDYRTTPSVKASGKSTKRLLQEHPQCIICSDVDAECFVAFAQGSTALQGGGNPPSDETGMTSISRFAGTHVALCGHAVHNDCCKSYLIKAQEKEEEKSDIFRCPLCQRPSNCLVPFVDVGLDWIDSCTVSRMIVLSESGDASHLEKLSRQTAGVVWDGQASFVDRGDNQVVYSSYVAEPAEKSIYMRFVDRVSVVSCEADEARLGRKDLEKDFGEFRHHMTETIVHNSEIQALGQDQIEWPACVFGGSLPKQVYQQALLREKVIANQMEAIRAFAYSCCCEAAAARDMIGDNYNDDSLLRSVYSKFGIGSVSYDGKLLLMPRPDPNIDGGTHPFNGRIGRLRYFGLAVAATSGAFASDLIQLALQFPVLAISSDDDTKVVRSPIAYPILSGHVLTHVVAAICASIGKARSSADSLHSLWKTFLPSYSAGVALPDKAKDIHVSAMDEVVNEGVSLLKLGVVARTLQVLLLHMTPITSSMENPSGLIRSLGQLINTEGTRSDLRGEWISFCLDLLKGAIIGRKRQEEEEDSPPYEAQKDFIEVWQDACVFAAKAASSFLLDAGLIFQILVPGFCPQPDIAKDLPSCEQDGKDKDFVLIDKLCKAFFVGNFASLLSPPRTSEILSNWFEQACHREVLASSSVLFRTQGYRGLDWPCFLSSSMDSHALQAVPATPSMKKKPAPLIGSARKNGGGIHRLASSYMDLYAKASKIRPDAERTAVCLVCGQVLNAGGKGECTTHSYTCGAGTGIFFLLQDYVGLIMHKGFGSYIRSIYVDSHGETPVGRPLFLDVARYEHLRGLWFGHGVRQQVITEREATQQGIVPNFY